MGAKCSHQEPFSARDCQVSLSPKKNLSELFGGNAFLEPAFEDPVMPTAGPRGSAWGGRVTKGHICSRKQADGAP